MEQSGIKRFSGKKIIEKLSKTFMFKYFAMG